MNPACAEHEATLHIALERVKRLEEALRGLLSAAIDLHNCGEYLCNCRDEAVTRARAALRPEGT